MILHEYIVKGFYHESEATFLSPKDALYYMKQAHPQAEMNTAKSGGTLWTEDGATYCIEHWSFDVDPNTIKVEYLDATKQD